jgi:hypothetical protein
LDISYTNSTSIIELPLGNHSIDELADVLNRRLLFGFKAAYSENTNTLRFSSESIGSALVIGPATTCGGLLGVRAGDTSVLGSYNAPGGVNLAGIISFYLRSNLRTRHRDPRFMGYSAIIANVPITKPHNGAGALLSVGLHVRHPGALHPLRCYQILDDALEPVTFYNGQWQVTLDFAAEEAEG